MPCLLCERYPLACSRFVMWPTNSRRTHNNAPPLIAGSFQCRTHHNVPSPSLGNPIIMCSPNSPATLLSPPLGIPELASNRSPGSCAPLPWQPMTTRLRHCSLSVTASTPSVAFPRYQIHISYYLYYLVLHEYNIANTVRVIPRSLPQ